MLRFPRLSIPHSLAAQLQAAMGDSAAADSSLALERRLAELLGCRAIELFRGGRYALWRALEARRGQGREVLVPAFGCTIVPQVVLAAGLVPRLVDVDPAGFHLAPTDLYRKLSPQTAAVVVVHEFGYPAPREIGEEIRRRCNALVIEDAAIALGARYADGSRIGALGDAIVVSGGLGKPVSADRFGALAWRLHAADGPHGQKSGRQDHGWSGLLRLAAAGVAAWPPMFGLLVPLLERVSKADAAEVDPGRRFDLPSRFDCRLMSEMLERLDELRAERARAAGPLRDVLAEAGWRSLPDDQLPMIQRIPFYVPVGMARDDVARMLLRHGIDATRPGRTDLRTIAGVRHDNDTPCADEAVRRLLSITIRPGIDPDDLAQRTRKAIAACQKR